MNIIVKTKNIGLTLPLRAFIEQKIGSLEKYFNLFQKNENPTDSNINAAVEVGKTTRHHRKGEIWRAEVLLTFHRNTIRAAKSANDLKKAIAAVRDDLQRQITDFKETMIDKSRK